MIEKYFILICGYKGKHNVPYINHDIRKSEECICDEILEHNLMCVFLSNIYNHIETQPFLQDK